MHHNKCSRCLAQHGLHRWDVKVSRGAQYLEIVTTKATVSEARCEAIGWFRERFDGKLPDSIVSSHLYVDIAGTN